MSWLNNWFLQALIAMLSFSTAFLLVKKATTLNISNVIIIIYSFFIGGISLLIYQLIIDKSKLFPKGQALYTLILIGIVSIVANLTLIKAIEKAPNPGYALSINSAQILIVTIAAIYLFNSEINTLKIIGVILTTIGIILLGF